MNHWLVKSEPESYSWDMLVHDQGTVWSGVRNYQARNHLAGMKAGDLVLFYHSNNGKQIVGVAKVKQEAYQDPTSQDPRWLAVDLEPSEPLNHPVGLDKIKSDPLLENISLVKQGRLSVMALDAKEFDRIIALSFKE